MGSKPSYSYRIDLKYAHNQKRTFFFLVSGIGAALFLIPYLLLTYEPQSELSRSAAMFHEGNYNEAFRILDQVPRSAQNSQYFNFYAWTLTTVPKLELRDYPKAIEYAVKSVRTIPNQFQKQLYPRHYNTLACAYYGIGQKGAAISLATHTGLQARAQSFEANLPCEDPKLYQTKSDSIGRKISSILNTN